MGWEKIKRLFALTVQGEPYIPTNDILKKRINNNLTIMNWMLLLLLMTLYASFIAVNQMAKSYWLVMSVFVFVFIISLHTSQRMDKLVLELRNTRGE